MRRQITNQEVILIKHLSHLGYREKLIKMIVKDCSQSAINKIINGNARVDIKYDPKIGAEITDEQLGRLKAVDRIISCPALFTNDLDDEITYLHVLKFFMVEKTELYRKFPHLAKSRINKYLSKKEVDILRFHPQLIGVEPSVYYDLILDFFTEE